MLSAADAHDTDGTPGRVTGLRLELLLDAGLPPRVRRTHVVAQKVGDRLGHLVRLIRNELELHDATLDGRFQTRLNEGFWLSKGLVPPFG